MLIRRLSPRRSTAVSMLRVACSNLAGVPWLIVVPCLFAGTAAAAEPAEARRVNSAIFAAWQAMRQLDCARCHGRDYTGSVGGSLLEAARTRSREEFRRLVLEGQLTRGMPPYSSVSLAVDNVDGMYDYLRGRADGTIPSGTLTRE
jgi:mono/diheme cytochrome c family protein